MANATATPPETDEGRRIREAREADEAGAEQGVAVGESEADIEGEGEGEEGPPPLILEGMGQKLSTRISGRAPDKGTAKMVGGKIELPEGEFQPGDVIDATVRLRCTKISIIEKMNNSTGDVVEREREHQFKLMSIERTS